MRKFVAFTILFFVFFLTTTVFSAEPVPPIKGVESTVTTQDIPAEVKKPVAEVQKEDLEKILLNSLSAKTAAENAAKKAGNAKDAAKTAAANSLSAKTAAEEAANKAGEAKDAAEAAAISSSTASSRAQSAREAALSAAGNSLSAKLAANSAADKAKIAAENTSIIKTYGFIGIVLISVLLFVVFLALLFILHQNKNVGDDIDFIIEKDNREKETIQAIVDKAVANVASQKREILQGINSLGDAYFAIKKDVAEIKGIVKPDPFTLRFTVAGEEWEYNVPVDKRGRFVSIYAPKVDLGDEPSNPSQTVRATYAEEKTLIKSCKSAIKEYAKPTCDPVQKNLINYLINSTEQLRKV